MFGFKINNQKFVNIFLPGSPGDECSLNDWRYIEREIILQEEKIKRTLSKYIFPMLHEIHHCCILTGLNFLRYVLDL